jgi:hypothetical protein
MNAKYASLARRMGWARWLLGAVLFLVSARSVLAQTTASAQLQPETEGMTASTPPNQDRGWSPPVSESALPQSYNFCETIRESIFGKPDPARPWQPLPYRTLSSEGWCEPWISPPNGSSGAVRQGWINDFQGFFSRDVFGVYSSTNRLGSGGNEHQGLFAVESPLNRRLMVGVYPVFLDSIQGAGRNDTSFGDVIISPKVMLNESEDLSVLAGLNIRVPTGEAVTAGDKTALSQQCPARLLLRAAMAGGGEGGECSFLVERDGFSAKERCFGCPSGSQGWACGERGRRTPPRRAPVARLTAQAV